MFTSPRYARFAYFGCPSGTANDSIKNAMGTITEETTELLESVAQVNERIQHLASSTAQIASATDVLADTMEKVRTEIENLAANK